MCLRWDVSRGSRTDTPSDVVRTCTGPRGSRPHGKCGVGFIRNVDGRSLGLYEEVLLGPPAP